MHTSIHFLDRLSPHYCQTVYESARPNQFFTGERFGGDNRHFSLAPHTDTTDDYKFNSFTCISAAGCASEAI